MTPTEIIHILGQMTVEVVPASLLCIIAVSFYYWNKRSDSFSLFINQRMMFIPVDNFDDISVM